MRLIELVKKIRYKLGKFSNKNTKYNVFIAFAALLSGVCDFDIDYFTCFEKVLTSVPSLLVIG